ncbi:MAG: flavodoxin family protein [Candidatus Delongbacteria bacterium]|jgi:multimeric flavodoxin WrbA|nr:flavodoxin family protein [Candidatus Delongbacteria bacterium]
MKILAISGSPRPNSNSRVLIDHAMKPFKEADWDVALFDLSELDIRSCNGCELCLDNNKCVIDDDMHKIYKEFFECDAVIISSPVYNRTFSSKLSATLERIYAIHSLYPLKMKPGGAMAVGAGTGAGQANTIQAIYTWMLSYGMICVPGELNGVTAKASDAGEIIHQERRLIQAEILGNNVIDVALKMKG